MKHYHVHEAKILQKTRKVSFYPTKPKTLCEKIPQKKYTCIALYGKKAYLEISSSLETKV